MFATDTSPIAPSTRLAAEMDPVVRESDHGVPESMMPPQDVSVPPHTNLDSFPPSLEYSLSPKDPCLEGTRLTTLEKIMLNLSSLARSVFLHGAPGTGKSALAKSLAGRLEREKRLAASFFFDRDMIGGTGIGASLPGLFVLELARQLARSEVAYSVPRLADVDGADASLLLQNLVIAPLSSASVASSPDSSSESPVIVLDALDECGDADSLGQIVSLIKSLDSLPPHYRVFFTSRPDTALCPFLTPNTITLNLDASKYRTEAESDIIRFTRQHFERMVPIESEPSWPPADDLVERFCTLSRGIFALAKKNLQVLEARDSGRSLTETIHHLIDQASTILPEDPANRPSSVPYCLPFRTFFLSYPPGAQETAPPLPLYEFFDEAYQEYSGPVVQDGFCWEWNGIPIEYALFRAVIEDVGGPHDVR